MSAQSKLIDTAIKCSCHEYVHPWTTSCVSAAAGLMLSSIPFSLRTYSVVYLASTLSLWQVSEVSLSAKGFPIVRYVD